VVPTIDIETAPFTPSIAPGVSQAPRVVIVRVWIGRHSILSLSAVSAVSYQQISMLSHASPKTSVRS
jgi:hypothetical protein